MWACRRKGKKPSLVRMGREIEDTFIRTDSGENSPKVIVYNVYSGEVRVS